jgi:hypothetical protein
MAWYSIKQRDNSAITLRLGKDILQIWEKKGRRKDRIVSNDGLGISGVGPSRYATTDLYFTSTELMVRCCRPIIFKVVQEMFAADH